MPNIIETISQEFTREAQNSPILMEDLANMEHYISESYSGRSLIELLQNADDACAKHFIVSFIDDEYAIVANDGRKFTNEDLYSLCRSGASTKKRKSNAIGFRGIGFKSVVNYSKEVHLVSGDISATFSKELTEAKLPTVKNVPLIRIPHQFSGEKYLSEIRKFIEHGYNTVFVFEISNKSLDDEIREFDPSCLLFLRNISEVEFRGKISENFKVSRVIAGDNTTITTVDTENRAEKWLVYGNNENSYAFKMLDEFVTASESNESVVHSFMPTRDKFCLPCKINGDFSTDPSRTKVVLDDETNNVINSSVDMLVALISQLISTEDKYRIIETLSSINGDSILLSSVSGDNFNSLFFKVFRKRLHEVLDKKNILLKPDWMSSSTYMELVVDTGFETITQNDEENVPGITQLLDTMGFNKIKMKWILSTLSNKIVDAKSRIEIIAEIIQETRFSVDNDTKKDILNSYLFSTNGRIVKTRDLKGNIIDSEFYDNILSMIPDEQDFYWFAQKINVTDSIPKSEDTEEDNASDESDVESISAGNADIEKEGYGDNDDMSHNSGGKEKRKYVPVLHKWRSAEQNVVEYLRGKPGIKNVKDVASMNVGYDIESISEDGTSHYYEVKSLESMGDAFTLTNNEYSSANLYGSSYSLALATMSENQFLVCFIQNPIEELKLEKRVVRWEWVCNSYSHEKIFTASMDEN